jgi:hypothetical protein
MTHHIDRFFAAVSILAGHGNIKQRLITAYEGQLEDIVDDELPIAIHQAFADLRFQLHRVAPLNGEGTICASVRKMSSAEASECARSVVEMFREVSRQADDSDGVLSLSQGSAERVPPFLIKSV